MGDVHKVYPSAIELTTINTHLPCPQPGCASVFTSESNLHLHLAKTHQQPHYLQPTSDRLQEFYCPDPGCDSHSIRPFKTLKLLKQHYLKVHSPKIHACDHCPLSFATLAAKNGHRAYCGVQFHCCDCAHAYNAYESLLTHARRKHHAILDKRMYKPNMAVGHVEGVRSIPSMRVSCKELFILPKTAHARSEPCLTSEKASQTTERMPANVQTKQVQVGRGRGRKNASQHSQTAASRGRHLGACAETQTIGDFARKRQRVAEDARAQANTRNTQTRRVNCETKSCNTSLEMQETMADDLTRTSSGTQTATSIQNDLLYSIATATHDTIHTDTADLNFELMINTSSQTCFDATMASLLDDAASTFYNCSIETQTDALLEERVLELELEGAGQRRTLGEEPYGLLSGARDVLFSTSQTQTWLEDMAKSVESQTMVSQRPCGLMAMGCRDTAHIYTQTEIDFKKLLEEINA